MSRNLEIEKKRKASILRFRIYVHSSDLGNHIVSIGFRFWVN